MLDRGLVPARPGDRGGGASHPGGDPHGGAEAGLAVKQTFDAALASAAGTVGLDPGESFSVAVNELFDVLAPGSTVVHSATSSDPLV